MVDFQRHPVNGSEIAEALSYILESKRSVHFSNWREFGSFCGKIKQAERWFPRDLPLARGISLSHVKFLQLILAAILLVSCAPQVTRDEAIATAYRYTQVQWMPESRHVRHGPDSQGIVVHTPDRTIAKHCDRRGWWEPGIAAKGMPYQWGGFDTPESFLTKIAAGKTAGDVGDAAKRKLGDSGTSAESCGIDCSGFVSRCWNLRRPYSTRELHQICDPLASWEELRPGDILLNDKHVVLFVKWKVPGQEIAAYEAGPFPVWRVSACGLYREKLLKEGYAPWRYRGMMKNSQDESRATLTGNGTRP